MNAMTSDATPIASAPSRKKRIVFMVAMLTLALGIALVGRNFRPLPPLPVIGQIPAFSLIDHRGARFDATSLAGKAWVADFIFTSCKQSCPRLTARMTQLHDLVAKKRGNKDLGVRFVSFSVDPDNDTPEVLSAYAARMKADPASWSFVTGPSEDVQSTIVKGFKVTAQRIDQGAGEYDVLHGNWFVLGDGAGLIRGYYSTDTDADIDVIARDVLRIVEAGGK